MANVFKHKRDRERKSFIDTNGSACSAGAGPGLQNRGVDDVSTKPRKGLGKPTNEVTAQGPHRASNDPELSAIIDAWDRLPEALRAGIVAMVKAAAKRRDR